MHDAYLGAAILERLPLTIESIACYGSTLLVGTKQGVLLQYRVQRNRSSGEIKFDVELQRSNKSFAKKPITQLAAVPQLYILISLSDNVISVHDLTTFNLISCVHKTKGANLFAVDLQNDSDGDQVGLRIGVASKRKIQLFTWKNREFHEYKLGELSLYDFPHAFSWCKNSLCVGFKRDYYIINSDSGSHKELFPVGSNQTDPLVTRLQDNRLALGRDKMSILINEHGEPTQKEAITWSDIPTAMEHCPPYLIAVLPSFVEVRTLEPKRTIQNISLSKLKYICQGDGCIYVASANNVWRLAPVPYSQQIRQLLENKDFELAVKLAELAEEPESEKQNRLRIINNLYACHLFCQKKFDESLNLFFDLGTDPSHVIGLYPDLLPPEFRKTLDYPEKVPDFDGADLERALMALIEYLTRKRHALSKDMNKEMLTTAIMDGNRTIQSRKQLSQIIDTTLLKCYLQTNDAFVAPLLRLKDNSCHVEESERVLKKKEKYSELIILYEKKGLHQKALSCLMKQAARPDSPLKGHERTVEYLQHLGDEYRDLIFKYAEWVLKQFPKDGLKIFTEDLPEVESLPRDKVLEYLEATCPDLAMPYLEHIVLECGEENGVFHNQLIDLYRSKVQALREEYLNSLPEGDLMNKGDDESGEMGQMRRKLIDFLHTSQHYIPERLLTRFPNDGFYEERAILLGRLGRHEQALSIYIHTLKDYQLAEEYCNKNYDKDKEGHKDVYYLMLKMFLEGDNFSSYRHLGKTKLDVAFKLLEHHAMKIDTSKVLELLPSSTKLRDILSFLENVMENQAVQKRSAQVLKSMLYAENLQVTGQLIEKQTVRVNITEEEVCKHCKRRIGQSVFCRYPNGHLVHFSCYNKSKETNS